jgi:flagellar protein FliS
MTPAPLHSRVSAAYRDAESFPPARQIVLLYDRAIRHLEDAATAARGRRLEARFNHVVKAQAIVGALQSCLDFELGGEIAPMLDRLYGHILRRLMLIELDDDTTIRQELLPLLRQLREGWAVLADDSAAVATPPRPTATGPALLCA